MPWPRRDFDWQTRFLRGDKDVIEEIYRTTFHQIRQAAARVLREPADRDVVVHEVFVELLASRALRESHRGGDLGAWLAAIARHRALDLARRERRLRSLSEITAPEVGVDPLEEVRADIRRFAAGLDPERRRLLDLRYLQGMTQMEAAVAMGMPRSTLEDWERELKRLLAAFMAPGAGARAKAAAR